MITAGFALALSFQALTVFDGNGVIDRQTQKPVVDQPVTGAQRQRVQMDTLNRNMTANANPCGALENAMAQVGVINDRLSARAEALRELTVREPEASEARANANAIAGSTEGLSAALGNIIYASAELCEVKAVAP